MNKNKHDNTFKAPSSDAKVVNLGSFGNRKKAVPEALNPA